VRDRDAATTRDLICHQNATIISKSAFAASDVESRVKRRGDRKLHDSIPPLLPSVAAAPAQPRSALATWTARPPLSISIGCWLKEGVKTSTGRAVVSYLLIYGRP